MSGENENMSAGTIKLTNGSTAVVGTSTTFTTDLKSGDVITTTISGVFYTLFIDTVTSATAATITDAFTGPTTTGAAYVAVPAQTMSRVPAQLAILTQEAVRRVLQENVNWQAFYSGSGDITITLPNGTPTGLPITGPSWAKLQSTIGNPLQLRGELASATNLNTINPGVAANVGVWGKSGSTGATIANGYPEDNARGILEVFPYGQSNGGQRFTVSASGRQYFRTLAGTWNGTDGPWGAWIDVSKTALSSTLVTGSATDLNTYNSASQYGVIRVSSASGATTALNWPYDGFGGYVEIMQGFSGFAQQTAMSSNGNMFTRYATSATAWSEWSNVGGLSQNVVLPATAGLSDAAYFSQSVTYVISGTRTDLPAGANSNAVIMSIRRGGGTIAGINQMLFTTVGVYYRAGAPNVATNWTSVAWYAGGDANGWRLMGNDAMAAIGLGASSMVLSAGLDWQNADFITGSISRYTWQTFTNPPTLTGPQPAATANMVVTVKAVIGTTIVVELSAIRGAAAYESYDIYITGAKGSRVLNVRMMYQNGMSVAVAVSDGGTGATTAAAARTNLGLKGASILDVGTVAGTVAAGNDSRILGAVQNTGGNITGSFVLNASGAYLSNTAAARYTSGSVTYLDIWRFTQVDIGGVGTQGNLQFVANPGNYLSFELAPGNGSHSFRHDGKIVTNAGTVAFQSSDGRIKNKKGKPGGSPINRVRGLAKSATQDYLWLNYQGDFNTYRYEQPQRGFIAQDAWDVDPTYASKPQNGADDEMPDNGDAIWGVNTNAILADVVLSVDEQQTDIEGLRQTIADQQTQIAQLTIAIEQLSQQIHALSQPAAQS